LVVLDSNETISGNRPGKEQVLKDIVSETQIYRRIYKDMRGFGRIHKARHTYNQVYIYTKNQRDARIYKDIEGDTTIHKARRTYNQDSL